MAPDRLRVTLPLPVYFEHDFILGPIGLVNRLEYSTSGVNVRAEMFGRNAAADYTWQLIERAEVKALSLGGTLFHSYFHLDEISVCRQGRDPHAQISIATLRNVARRRGNLLATVFSVLSSF